MEFMSVMIGNTQPVNEFMRLLRLESHLCLPYVILLFIILSQLFNQYCILRPSVFVAISLLPILPTPHHIIIGLLVTIALLLEVIKTSERNFIYDIADSSEWIKVAHYSILIIDILLARYYYHWVHNGIMVVIWLGMLIYRISVPRKDMLLKKIHENQYLMCAAFAVDRLVRGDAPRLNSLSTILTIIVILIIFNYLVT